MISSSSYGRNFFLTWNFVHHWQCSAPGRLLHFSLDLETDSSLDRSGVLDDAALDWRGLALSKQSLRSLHYSWRYPTSINGLVSYKLLNTCHGFASLTLTSHLRPLSLGILSSPFRTCRWRWKSERPKSKHYGTSLILSLTSRNYP